MLIVAQYNGKPNSFGQKKIATLYGRGQTLTIQCNGSELFQC